MVKKLLPLLPAMVVTDSPTNTNSAIGETFVYCPDLDPKQYDQFKQTLKHKTDQNYDLGKDEKIVFERKYIKDLVHAITSQLKKKGLKSPLLILPFRPQHHDEDLKKFLNKVFVNSVPIPEKEYLEIIKETKEYILMSALKFIWCRLPGKAVIGWKSYTKFVKLEDEAGFPDKAFLQFMPNCLSSGAHASIVYDFFDLIVALALNSKDNLLTPNKLTRVCGLWAFNPVKNKVPGVPSFERGLYEWIPAGDAMFHLLLAFIKSMPPNGDFSKLPRVFQKLLRTSEYPPLTTSSTLEKSRSLQEIPMVTIKSYKPSKNPAELLTKVNKALKFDDPTVFYTREDFLLLKRLFKEPNQVMEKLSPEGSRILENLCLYDRDLINVGSQSSGLNYKLLPGWSIDMTSRFSPEFKEKEKDFFSAVIGRVSIDDYFIWTWLCSLGIEETDLKKKTFGKSYIMEVELAEGFKKWVIIEEQDLERDGYDIEMEIKQEKLKKLEREIAKAELEAKKIKEKAMKDIERLEEERKAAVEKKKSLPPLPKDDKISDIPPRSKSRRRPPANGDENNAEHQKRSKEGLLRISLPEFEIDDDFLSYAELGIDGDVGYHDDSEPNSNYLEENSPTRELNVGINSNAAPPYKAQTPIYQNSQPIRSPPRPVYSEPAHRPPQIIQQSDQRTQWPSPREQSPEPRLPSPGRLQQSPRHVQPSHQPREVYPAYQSQTTALYSPPLSSPRKGDHYSQKYTPEQRQNFVEQEQHVQPRTSPVPLPYNHEPGHSSGEIPQPRRKSPQLRASHSPVRESQNSKSPSTAYHTPKSDNDRDRSFKSPSPFNLPLSTQELVSETLKSPEQDISFQAPVLEPDNSQNVPVAGRESSPQCIIPSVTVDTSPELQQQPEFAQKPLPLPKAKSEAVIEKIGFPGRSPVAIKQIFNEFDDLENDFKDCLNDLDLQNSIVEKERNVSSVSRLRKEPPMMQSSVYSESSSVYPPTQIGSTATKMNQLLSVSDNNTDTQDSSGRHPNHSTSNSDATSFTESEPKMTPPRRHVPTRSIGQVMQPQYEKSPAQSPSQYPPAQQRPTQYQDGKILPQTQEDSQRQRSSNSDGAQLSSPPHHQRQFSQGRQEQLPQKTQQQERPYSMHPPFSAPPPQSAYQPQPYQPQPYQQQHYQPQHYQQQPYQPQSYQQPIQKQEQQQQQQQQQASRPPLTDKRKSRAPGSVPQYPRYSSAGYAPPNGPGYAYPPAGHYPPTPQLPTGYYPPPSQGGYFPPPNGYPQNYTPPPQGYYVPYPQQNQKGARPPNFQKVSSGGVSPNRHSEVENNSATYSSNVINHMPVAGKVSKLHGPKSVDKKNARNAFMSDSFGI